MSTRHPIIAVTGSSGAGTSTARVAFERIFHRLNIKPAFVEGDAFHALDREHMAEAMQKATIRGENFTHFGPEANLLDRLDTLFAEYAQSGTGQTRHYLHDAIQAEVFGQRPGTFTAWQPLPSDSDLLMYEGLHGGAVTERVNLARHVDLLVGMTPTINLEWIQKIHRDTEERHREPEQVRQNILRRIPDYVRYITPQFSRADINFQRVPLVDTSNPFIARDVPNADESMVVIRFRNPADWPVDFPYLLTMIQNSFMSRPNTIVVPGTKMRMAIEIIVGPLVEALLARRRTHNFTQLQNL